MSAAPGDRDAQAIPFGGPLPSDPPKLRRWLTTVTSPDVDSDEAAEDCGLPEDWPRERPP